MFADHGGKLEAIELRHAHVDENDGDVLLEKLLQSLAGGRRFDEILTELGKNGLVAQELCRLVIDQQNVDLVGGHGAHCPLPMEPHAQRR